MKAIGISVTVPVSTGAQLVFQSLAGVILFNEWNTTKTLSMGTIAMIILILGIDHPDGAVAKPGHGVVNRCDVK